MEFIRRDLEGSDTETRRRAASDLIRGLLEHFAQDVTKICSEFIQEYLQEYERDKVKNWRAKDSAMYLLTALSAKALTVQVFVCAAYRIP
jgi:exportin-2 (importin alpha re-exporter)